jgi:hypothetical protein
MYLLSTKTYNELEDYKIGIFINKKVLYKIYQIPKSEVKYFSKIISSQVKTLDDLFKTMIRIKELNYG